MNTVGIVMGGWVGGGVPENAGAAHALSCGMGMVKTGVGGWVGGGVYIGRIRHPGNEYGME